jgi:hypothetical protein
MMVIFGTGELELYHILLTNKDLEIITIAECE